MHKVSLFSFAIDLNSVMFCNVFKACLEQLFIFFEGFGCLNIIFIAFEVNKVSVECQFDNTVIEIERTLREIALASNIDPGHKTVRLLPQELVKGGTIDNQTFDAIVKVWAVRNAIVHARPFSKSEALAALDLSATVLVFFKETLEKLRA